MSDIQKRQICHYVPFQSVNGLTLVVHIPTGQTFASIANLSIITGTHKRTIQRYVNKRVEVTEIDTTDKGAAFSDVLSTQILTGGGIQGEAFLLNELQMLDVIEEYAPKMLRLFAQAGLRLYLHEQIGFRHRSTTGKH